MPILQHQSFTCVKEKKSVPILEQIVYYKFQEVEQRKKQLSLVNLQNQLNSCPASRNFLATLQENSRKPSLIAEVKKASPSKGVICPNFNPIQIAQAYERANATCLSVLTDENFFQGSFDNLRAIRKEVSLPLLCKEFVIDHYQIYLARVSGADAILLIAAILSNEELQDFLQIAHSLGMNALIEVHTLTQLDRVLSLSEVQLIGINNRNLEDFSVDLETTQKLLTQRREQLNNLDITVVSESGLKTKEDLALVKSFGADAVLIGESLVRQTNLEQAVHNLF